MSVHIQSDEIIYSQYQVKQPRVTAVAVAMGLLSAFVLMLLGYPLLVSAGLWMLAMALVCIFFAVVSYHRFAVPVWETAIAGQVMGLVGIGLLIAVSFVTV